MIRFLLRPFERRWVMARGTVPPKWIHDRWYWGDLADGCYFAPSPGPTNDWGHTAQVRTPNGIVTAKQGDTIMIRFGRLYVEAA